MIESARVVYKECVCVVVLKRLWFVPSGEFEALEETKLKELNIRHHVSLYFWYPLKLTQLALKLFML